MQYDLSQRLLIIGVPKKMQERQLRTTERSEVISRHAKCDRNSIMCAHMHL